MPSVVMTGQSGEPWPTSTGQRSPCCLSFHLVKYEHLKAVATNTATTGNGCRAYLNHVHDDLSNVCRTRRPMWNGWDAAQALLPPKIAGGAILSVREQKVLGPLMRGHWRRAIFVQEFGTASLYHLFEYA